MAQFPIEDAPGLYEAVNNLLSGPAGLGQNFSGNSSYLPVYIRATPRGLGPFTLPINSTLNTSWYVNIPINNIVPIVPPVGNPSQLTVTFTAAQPTAPFQFGDLVTLTGVTPAAFNGTYTVFSCTPTQVILTGTAQVWPAYIGGGAVGRDFSNQLISTDANARVTVEGGSDRVFIAAQIELDYTYTASLPSNYDILVQINRYAARDNYNTPSSLLFSGVNTNLDYLFTYQSTVAQKILNRSVTTSGTDTIDLAFTTILDGPDLQKDYYWYILEISFVTAPTIPRVYGTGLGGTITNAFTAAGTINQAVVPGTSFPGIALTTVTGSGLGAVATITLTPDPIFTLYYVGPTTSPDFNCGVVITTPGTGYAVGDVLSVPGTALGGASPANDLLLTITSVQYAGDAKPGSFIEQQRSLSAQVVKQ